MKFFQNRTKGFWTGAAAALIFLIADVAFLATNHSDRVFSWITFALILAGVVFEILVTVTDLKIMPLLSAVCFGAGLSFHLYIGFPTLSDIMTGVNFIGGNADAVIIFGVICLAGTILSAISCFCDQRKTIEIQK